MVVYKIRLLQETLKFHILADNFPGEDVDFRAYVISVRIVTGNDFFVSVKDSPAYLFQFVNGDYVIDVYKRQPPLCERHFRSLYERAPDGEPFDRSARRCV